MAVILKWFPLYSGLTIIALNLATVTAAASGVLGPPVMPMNVITSFSPTRRPQLKVISPATGLNTSNAIGNPSNTSKLGKHFSSPLPSASRLPVSDFSQHPNFPLLPPLNECGHDAYYKPGVRTSSASRGRVKRIVQGVPAGFGNYPWMAQIMVANIVGAPEDQYLYHRCGGAIINNDTILTAAHCVSFPEIPTGYAVTHVVLGNYKNAAGHFINERSSDSFENCGTGNRTGLCATASLVEIDEIIIHEDYVIGGIATNDIALIRLRESITSFDPIVNSTDAGDLQLIRPVCLPTRRDMLDESSAMGTDTKLEFVGFGSMRSYKDAVTIHPTQLMKLTMVLKPREFCGDVFGRLYGKVDETRLCASSQPGRDTCQGDSGGPLMVPSDDVNGRTQVFLVGLLTGGGLTRCGRPGHPSLFANVIHYMPWILDNLQSPIKPSAKAAASSTPRPIQPQNFDEHPNFKLLPSRDVCGYPLKPSHTNDTTNSLLLRRKRVVGGRLAFAGEIPGVARIETVYQIANETYYLSFSGVLISSRYALTTASLMKSNLKTGYLVHSVGLRSNEISNQPYSYRIEKIIFHEDYENDTRTNDIALLRLAKEVNFEAETNPVCLPDLQVTGDENEFSSIQQKSSACSTSSLIGVGWGTTHMNYIEMQLRPNDHCDRVHATNLGKIGLSKLCASSCLGDLTGLCGSTDMGSPLLNSIEQPNGQKQYTLYGLASHFDACGIQSLPAIYTNIRHYVPWILDNIRP